LITVFFKVEVNLAIEEGTSDGEEEVVDEADFGEGSGSMFRGVERDVIEDEDEYFGG